MGIQSSAKINQLLTDWPSGAIYTSAWLKTLGYSQQHLQKYKSGGWLTPIESGAYQRTGDSVDWQGGVNALQAQLKLPVHVGGKTALEMHGSAQYLNFGESRVRLYAESKTHLPKWFTTHRWGPKIKFVSKGLFEFPAHLSDSRDALKAKGLTKKKFGQVELIYSTPERAILEYLDDLPKDSSYSEALDLVENLTSLRTQMLEELLKACTSIKVKRLFFHLANRANHAWFRRLDVGKIDLGKGKRLLFKNGRLDPKYLITVPKGADVE